jgi:hypothetical protein
VQVLCAFIEIARPGKYEKVGNKHMVVLQATSEHLSITPVLRFLSHISLPFPVEDRLFRLCRDGTLAQRGRRARGSATKRHRLELCGRREEPDLSPLPPFDPCNRFVDDFGEHPSYAERRHFSLTSLARPTDSPRLPRSLVGVAPM